MAYLNKQNFRLKLKQGLVANINATATTNEAAIGEPHYATDTECLYLFNGTLNVPGTGRTNITEVDAATYDVLESDHILHVTYTATGAVTSITLPTAQVIKGRMIIIKDAGGQAATNNITIDTEGSEKIDGGDTYIINGDYASITLYSEGSHWYVI